MTEEIKPLVMGDDPAGRMRAVNSIVEAKMKEIEASGDIVALLISYHNLKQAYAAVDAERKALYAIMDRYDKAVIPAALEKMGTDKLRVPEIGRSFYTQTKYSASIKDKPTAYQWLRANGGSELIQTTVNAGTLASFLKERLVEQGLDAPECVELKTYTTTGSSAYTPK